MNALASIGIVVLAMLIMASLQLVPGVFALFFHYARGKYSFKKASSLSLFFILGSEIISAVFFISAFYVSYILFLNDLDPRNNVLTWIFIGIFLALSVACFFFYYKHPHSKQDTELFISRKLVRNIDDRVKSAKTPSDAFTIGALSNVCELPITLPLYIVTATEIMYMHTEYFADNIMTILYILVSSIPLIYLYWRFRIGQNLAIIQRSRIKDKSFSRIAISLSFFTIAILIICFRIA